MDVYKTWTGVHGPGPWTTPWTWSMDQLHGPPLIFKGKSPLLIWKFTRGQGMKNTDSYLLLTPLRVCLVKEGCFWIATHINGKKTNSFWDVQDLVHFYLQYFHSNTFKLQFNREDTTSPCFLLMDDIIHEGRRQSNGTHSLTRFWLIYSLKLD